MVSAPRRRVARKAHRCGACDSPSIWVGDVYLVHTDFPGSGVGYGDHVGHPVQMAECAVCATRYGRDSVLDPVPWAQVARQGLAGIR